MPARVLLVDDEPAVLSGYERSLHRDFDVETALGGELGLQAITERGPYAVIVSDMRMPKMNGSEFLKRAKEMAPDSVRMLLTGYTDLTAAIEAINEGNIFRFLTKPCVKEDLVVALNAGVDQYLLIRSQKQLLEETLVGSIKVMADFLSAASPEAFGRSVRIVHVVRHIAAQFKLEHGWRLEAAASLSQLGCVTLDAEVIQRAFVERMLSPEDQVRFDTHPDAAVRLLSGIPRLEEVAWMIGQQLKPSMTIEATANSALPQRETLLGAQILRLAIVFDDLLLRPLSEQQAILWLRSRPLEFGRDLVDALHGFHPQVVSMVQRRIAVLRLSTGMLIDEEIRNKQGMLLVSKGQEITRAILIKLENFAEAGSINREILVLAPA